MTGLTVLGSGFSTQGDTDGDVAVSVDEDCSKGSVKMSPPAGETWTGVVESVSGSEVVQTPVGGQTVTGGGNGSIQLSLSSSNAHVKRAVVVEGDSLDGTVVAEDTCEAESGQEQETQGDRQRTRSEATSRSVSVSESSQVNVDREDAESIVTSILKQFGLY